MGERAAAKQMAVEDYARRLTARGKGLGAMLRPLSYVIPHWWVVALMVGGTVLYALCRQGKLFAIKPFVDKVMPLGEGFWSELGFLVTVLAALAVGEAVFRAIKDYSVKYVQYRANIDIQRKVFGRTLSQEMTFYSRWKLGDILQRLVNFLRCPGGHDAFALLHHALGNSADLIEGFPLAENRFRKSPPQSTMVVHHGVANILERQIPQSADRLVDFCIPCLNCLEKIQ